MNIRLAIQCCNFERRLCWMLSSLFDNYYNDGHHSVPKGCLNISVASLNGIDSDPNINKVVQYFNELFKQKCPAITIDHLVYDNKDRFAHRGLVRNDQIVADLNNSRMKTDWLFFADCDGIYCPTYFYELEKELNKYNEPCVLSSGRMSCDLNYSNNKINNHNYNIPYINNSFDNFYLEATGKYQCRNVCAGFSQLIKIKWCDGYYVEENKCGDRHLFNKGQLIRSDRQFRNRFNKIKLPDWFSKGMIHAQHNRDNGTHISEQR